jgi:hypothetical protein
MYIISQWIEPRIVAELAELANHSDYILSTLNTRNGQEIILICLLSGAMCNAPILN